jgi:hypothetical protein
MYLYLFVYFYCLQSNLYCYYCYYFTTIIIVNFIVILFSAINFFSILFSATAAASAAPPPLMLMEYIITPIYFITIINIVWRLLTPEYPSFSSVRSSSTNNLLDGAQNFFPGASKSRAD